MRQQWEKEEVDVRMLIKSLTLDLETAEASVTPLESSYSHEVRTHARTRTHARLIQPSS
jgi:tRNA A-37 threonylcarbamoyl transferase component Bud32